MHTDYRPWWISFIGISIIILIHLCTPTMLNGFSTNEPNTLGINIWNHHYGYNLCYDRLKSVEFYRRPIMYQTEIGLHKIGVPYQFSFFAISMLCLFFTGIILYKNAILLKVNRNFAWTTLLAYYSHFTILFAFYGSISTYDEPIMYLFLSSTFYFWLKNKLWVSWPFFIMAAIARESALFYLPLLLFIPINYGSKQRVWYITAILIAYLMFIIFYLPHEMQLQTTQFLIHKRLFAWQHNFKNMHESIQSLLCMFLSTGILCFVMYKSLSFQAILPIQKNLLKYTIVFIVFNNLLVLVGGLAIEARLFALPLLIGWSLVPIYAAQLKINQFIFSKYYLVLLLGVFISVVFFIKYGYVCREYDLVCARLFKVYAIVYLFLFVVLYLNSRFTSRNMKA